MPPSITVAVTRFSAVLTFVVPIGPLPEVIDSGFRPGTDDWQFPNYGVGPHHSASVPGRPPRRLWYYNERRAGSGPRRCYGLYDNDGGDKTPVLEDDADGIKLASMVQGDYRRPARSGRSALRRIDQRRPRPPPLPPSAAGSP